MRLPAEQRRRQLLEVACDVFATGGFHATAMDDVAAAAGVTKPVLYQHFPSKRALFLELLDDVGRQLLDDLQAATSRATTGRERVEEGFSAYFRFVTSNRAAFRLLFGASVRNDDEFAAVADRVLHEAAEVISVLIEIDGTAEHRRVLAHALVGIAEATSRHALTDPDASRDADELARWVSELAWFGLRGIRPEPAPLESQGSAGRAAHSGLGE
jgi:AcrR family transcriptional regulator